MTDCIKKASSILEDMDLFVSDLSTIQLAINVGAKILSYEPAKYKVKNIIDKLNELYSELEKLEGEN